MFSVTHLQMKQTETPMNIPAHYEEASVVSMAVVMAAVEEEVE